MTTPPRPEVLTLPATIAPGDIPVVCRHLTKVAVGNRAAVVLCDLGNLTRPDAVTLDALARLQLTAQRLGITIALTGTSSDLIELLTMSGFDTVLPVCLVSRVESIGQSELREVSGGVEEETDPTDSPVRDL